MAKKDRIRQRNQESMSEEFSNLLLPCLRACAHGRWGLFGQNNMADPEGRYWDWPQAKRLKELAEQIEIDGQEFAYQDEKCNRFLRLCRNLNSNTHGEPRLAELFLREIEATA